MKKALRLFVLSLLTVISSSAFAEEVVFETNAVKGAKTVTAGGITITTSTGSLAEAEYRFYKGAVATFSSTVGNITKVEFTCTANNKTKQGPGCFENPSTGAYAFEGSVGTWTGDAESFTLTAVSNQVRAKKIVVTYTPAAGAVIVPSMTGTDGFYKSTNVTLTTPTEGASIYYTLDGTEPTAESNLYAEPFAINETKTVKAIAVKDGKSSSVAEQTFNVAKAYSVAEAIAAIDAKETTTYPSVVSGVVTYMDVINSTTNKLTYYISEDATGTQSLEVYQGTSFNGEQFASQDAIKVGDKVAVKGVLTKYKEIYEFKAGAELVELNPETTAIENVAVEAAQNHVVYNLAGQKVGADYKGIVIKNGKKVMQ